MISSSSRVKVKVPLNRYILIEKLDKLRLIKTLGSNLNINLFDVKIRLMVESTVNQIKTWRYRFCSNYLNTQICPSRRERGADQLILKGEGQSSSQQIYFNRKVGQIAPY